jgi:hypothetical protein
MATARPTKRPRSWRPTSACAIDPSVRRSSPIPNAPRTALLWRHTDGWLYAGAYTARFKFTDGKCDPREQPTLFRGQWGLSQDD